MKYLQHRESIVVDSNAAMRNYTKTVNGVHALASLRQVKDRWADVIISDMAFEHVRIRPPSVAAKRWLRI